MTAGAVDLKVVGDRLMLARTAIADLREMAALDEPTFLGERRNAAAAESYLRRAIEALFDTARHLLAKGFGVGGLEYRDVARLAGEHRLVEDSALAIRLLQIAGFRDRLVHDYHDVTAREILAVVKHDLADLEAFAVQLETSAARLASKPVRGTDAST